MTMTNYTAANLSAEEIQQIQELERTLSDQTGEAVILVAYHSDEEKTS
ncbi:hypothetical protein [Paenibacillus sp. y28]